jgi:hypothetical protein
LHETPPPPDSFAPTLAISNHDKNSGGERPGRTRYAIGKLLKLAPTTFMPTLTSAEGAKGGYGTPERIQKAGDVSALLKAAGRHLPTLQVADATGGHKTRSGSRNSELLLNGVLQVGQSGGQPNPDYLDWYMGLPIGWTALGSLATSPPRSRPCSPGDS